MAKPTIETLTLWDAAIKLWDAGKRQNALDKLSQIQQRSAKILFNIGSAHLVLKQYNESYKILTEAVQKDGYLAVGYFQLGCALFHLKRYKESSTMFEECRTNLRGKNVVDYNQIGLRYKLYDCETLHNLGVTLAHRGSKDTAKEHVLRAQKLKVESRHKAVDVSLESLQNGGTGTLMGLPEDCLFRPDKKQVMNIEKVDYLGKAKVLSARDEEAAKSTGFDGPRNKDWLLQNGGSPGGSPRLGLQARLKATGDRKMSAPVVMTTKTDLAWLNKLKKKKKSSSSSSDEGSPSGTLNRISEQFQSQLSTGSAMERELAEKLRLQKSSTESGPSSTHSSPGSTFERRGVVNKKNRAPVLLPRKDKDVTHSNESLGLPKPAPPKSSSLDRTTPPESATDNSRTKPQSGGFVVQGRIIPPPPSRPPPKLKSDDPLPPLPGDVYTDVENQAPPPPPKLAPKPRKFVSVTLHCRTDKVTEIAHGTKLSGLQQEASDLFKLRKGTFDIWTREGGTGDMEPIADEMSMREVWSHVTDAKLELWCYGKE